MKKTGLFMLVIVMSMNHYALKAECSLGGVTGISLPSSGVTACSVKVNWKPVLNAAYYQVWYKVLGSTAIFTKVTVGFVTSHTVTGLTPGVKYTFKVVAFCQNNDQGVVNAGKNITTLVCALPTNIIIQSNDSTTAPVSWTLPCGGSDTYIRYRQIGEVPWTNVTTAATSITLTGLMPGTAYELQLNSCDTAVSGYWSSLQNFTTINSNTKPNIILIFLDDSPYNVFSCNGAPGFFHTPNIDRIAEEGVNFRNSFAVHSLCAPSRASVMTGMHTVQTGVLGNSYTGQLNPELLTHAEILHENGYKTFFIGKIHGELIKYSDGHHDYIMQAKSDDDDLKKNYSINGAINKKIPGYITDVLTDTAVRKIQTTNSPFYLWLSFTATHDPKVPSPPFVGDYDDETMPIPSNAARKTVDYPSFLDILKERNYKTGAELEEFYRKTYELIAQVDSNIGRIFSVLEATGKLQNTIIVFMSDNGYMYGNFTLTMKRIGYEDAIRLPIFIRYPKWFPTTGAVDESLVTNLDIPVSLLEAAGISNAFGMNGLSLKSIHEGDTSREYVLYHYWKVEEDGYEGILPYIRGIRSQTHKYLYYGCSADTVEEFFDLVNDPGEVNNLINDSANQSLIQFFRDEMAMGMTGIGDTLSEAKLPCFMANATGRIMHNSELDADSFPNPNPTEGIVYLPVSGRKDILSIDGRLLFNTSENEIDLRFHPPGIYILRVSNESEEKIFKIVKQ